MNPTVLQELNLLREFLDQQQDLGIVIGSHQTLDTVAAALSLYLSLSQAGKKIQIVTKKEPTVEVSNLVGIDKVGKSFQGNTTKLVVSLPYKKGEVEKVLFTEAPNAINFHLTAAAGQAITPFDEKDVKLIWEGGAPTSIIAVGVGSVDELRDLIDAQNTKIVNIDNYQGNTRFGDVILVEESFSSLSEIVGKIIKELHFPLDVDIAQNVLDGIMFATRGFTKNNTSPIAFEIASYAMYQGAKRQEIRTQQREPQQQRPQQDRGQHRTGGQDHPAFYMQNRQPGNQRTQVQEEQQPRQRIQPQPQPQQSQVAEETLVQGQNPQFDAPKQQDEPEVHNQEPEEVPEDWLMPKVFKSSKNGN